MRRDPRPSVLLAALVLVLTGCGGTSEEPAGESASGAREMGHVHGLGVDPADGTLYAAAHFGVFRIADGRATRVADRWQDTMAFTVVGPRTFLGSGHPDLDEGLPPSLGLIESTDAAETWHPLSLQGEVDFHALEVVGDRVVGYDAPGGRVLVTEDRKAWSTLVEATVVDLAPVPGRDAVLATLPDGSLIELDLGGKVSAVEGAPPLVWIDAAPDGPLAGIDQQGLVHVRAGADWEQAGRVEGHPTALEIGADDWYVATDRGIHRSRDRGRTWTPVLR